MVCAPILVSVYNRESIFKKCIQSLKRCVLANKTHLFIAIDAPYRDEDIDVNTRIVEYSKNITGFKQITLFIRPNNYGTNKNRILARKEIFTDYDRLIMFEDDNIFSKNFLVNINKCLEVYKNRKDIFSVSGWNMPFILPKNYKKEIYIWQGFSAWGVGIWRDKWQKMNYSLEKVEYWLNNKSHINKLNKISQHYFYALKQMKKNNKINGDGFISSYLIENEMFSIFPSSTLVKNIGHEGTGHNKFLSTKYIKQKINSDLFVDLPVDIQPDKKINKRLWWYFSNLNRFKDRFKHYYLNFFQTN